MAGPYRESEASSIDCPRCGVALPPGTLTACVYGCGVWAAAQVAPEVLEAAELAPSRLTTWFRERAPCPHCSEVMTLRGYDMSLFQGCDAHGYWVDGETVGQTGLGRASVSARLKQARTQADALKAERDRAAQAARDSAKAKEMDLAARVEAAQRDADQRAQAARLERARRDEALGPYLLMARELVRDHNAYPLARKLQDLDQLVAELRKRIEDLEARDQSSPTE